MRCIIECKQPLRNKTITITLKDEGIYVDDGRYERLVLNDEEEIEYIYDKLCKVAFLWKQEYVGERVYDGERYLIEFEINYKRKKYKIQNKFPENWEEFITVRDMILALDKE